MTRRVVSASESAPAEPAPAGGVPARGAPCWVNLLARDLRATQDFYAAVLGWSFRPGSLGEDFAVALLDGEPVAGV
ncbi:hypothetical protein ACGFZW_37715, partial [Streptomyces sp. NPDC048248]